MPLRGDLALGPLLAALRVVSVFTCCLGRTPLGQSGHLADVSFFLDLL